MLASSLYLLATGQWDCLGYIILLELIRLLDTFSLNETTDTKHNKISVLKK